MIGIKDLDRKISDYLEDKDVLCLISLNNYYEETFDEQYWKRRLLQKYSDYLPEKYNIYNENWKNYYLMISDFFMKQDYYDVIKFSIEEDRVDLLEIFHKKYDCSLNIIRDWYRRRESYLPFNIAIKNDSIECFKYICENLNVYSPSLSLSNAIRNHSHKIVNNLKEYSTEIHITLLFEVDCLECAKSLEEYFYKYSIINSLHLYRIIDKLLEKDNKSFHLFLNKLSYEDIYEYKKIALASDNFNVCKCLTKYTSYFK